MSLITFALTILVVTIIVIFSQEIKKLFKKIFVYKTIQIIVPLVIASSLVYAFEDWLLWATYFYRNFLTRTITLVSSLISYSQVAKPIAVILVLTLSSVLPVFILSFIFKKKSFIPFQYPYLTSTILWIITAILWFSSI